MAFFLHRSKQGQPLADDEKLRQSAIRAAAEAKEQAQSLMTSKKEVVPSGKKNSATVDIMAKTSVKDGPFRPPRTFDDPDGSTIEIHFGCLPSGDVELPSDDEYEEEKSFDATPPAAPSLKRDELVPPSAAASAGTRPPTSSTYGLQMQPSVTHFRMNIASSSSTSSSSASSSSSSSSSTTSVPSTSEPSSTSSSTSEPSTIRPDLVTTGGRVGHTPGIRSTGPTLYEQLMAEKEEEETTSKALDPTKHTLTTIKSTDVAPVYASRVAAAANAGASRSSRSSGSSGDSTTKSAAATTPFVLAPVQTMAEEMVRISELRRDSPGLAEKIMTQGNLLVQLATHGGAAEKVSMFEIFLNKCKPGEFLQWHIVKALQGAATEGHLELFKIMMRHGAPLRSTDGKPLGILAACVESGAATCGNVIRYLINECKLNVDASAPPDYYTHLHDACMRLDYPTVELLVELGAGVNSIAGDDAVPLGLTLARAKE